MDRLKTYLISVMQDRKKSGLASVTAFVLWMFSLAYRCGLYCVHAAYRLGIIRPFDAGIKVISIGNITLGGTGKTPFAINLALQLRKAGKRPAVLTRGYGDDEWRMMKEKLSDIPVLVGGDRVKNAKKAISAYNSDCIILDDGFQHRRIKKDIEIVMIDGAAPFGNRMLFPRGVLREPISRLKDAHIAIITKADMNKGNIAGIRRTLHDLNGDIQIREASYAPVCLKDMVGGELNPLSYIKGKRVALLAGIADPYYFEHMAKNLGADVLQRIYYSDHYKYKKGDIAFIIKKAQEADAEAVLTTEKDAVRLKDLKYAFKDIKIYSLVVEMKIHEDEHIFLDRLFSVLSG